MAKHRKPTHRLATTGLAAAGLGAVSIACAAIASADTTSIANVGNNQLGYSVGTTGGSVSVGGVKTTVDGFGTLHGGTTVTQNGKEVFAVEQDYNNGFDSVTRVNGAPISETELYYDGQFEQTFNAGGRSFELVCTPTTGCTNG